MPAFVPEAGTPTIKRPRAAVYSVKPVGQVASVVKAIKLEAKADPPGNLASIRSKLLLREVPQPESPIAILQSDRFVVLVQAAEANLNHHGKVKENANSSIIPVPTHPNNALLFFTPVDSFTLLQHLE